jgi:Luciferase
MILQIIKEISAWPDVTIGPHRFGGIEFRLGKREMGHLHADKLEQFTRLYY